MLVSQTEGNDQNFSTDFDRNQLEQFLESHLEKDPLHSEVSVPLFASKSAQNRLETLGLNEAELERWEDDQHIFYFGVNSNNETVMVAWKKSFSAKEALDVKKSLSSIVRFVVDDLLAKVDTEAKQSRWEKVRKRLLGGLVMARKKSEPVKKWRVLHSNRWRFEQSPLKDLEVTEEPVIVWVKPAEESLSQSFQIGDSASGENLN